MAKATDLTEVQLAYALARDDLAIYLSLTHRTDDGTAAMPPKHLMDYVIPAIEDDTLGDTVIIAPPGSIKTNTLMGAVEWWLGRDPTCHCGYVCSTGPEAVKRSLAIRDTIELNPSYMAVFPGILPNKDRGWSQDAWYLQRPNTGDKNPSLLAVGVGGALIGARLHRTVYDDLSDDENTKTDLQRKAVWRFLAEIGKTRMHPTLGRQVMIGTRQHEEDAIGYAIDRGWHQIRIPALDEQGESYWPSYFPAPWLACPNDEHATSGGQCCIKRELGTQGFARQYMGQVYNEESSIFKRQWWRIADGVPEDRPLRGCITIDTAGWDNRSTSADFACCAVWWTDGVEFWCEEVRRGRWSFAEAKQVATEMRDEYDVPIVVEDVPWARPLIQSLQEDVGWGIIPWKVQGRSKQNRAESKAPLVERGIVYLVRGAWNEAFIAEHAAFPDGRNDDQVDTTAMALTYLTQNKPREKRTAARPFSRNWERLTA